MHEIERSVEPALPVHVLTVFALQDHVDIADVVPLDLRREQNGTSLICLFKESLTFLPLEESNPEKPMTFIISISSGVFPCSCCSGISLLAAVM